MTKAPLKLVLISAALVLFCASGVFCAEILTGQPLVMLSPGHDKKDPGLENDSGIREFSATLELAGYLADFLSDTCRVRLARTSNDEIPDEPAPALANREKADLFISIHIHGNASTQPAVFYYDLPGPPGTDTWQTRALASLAGSKKLANAVAHAIKSDHPDTRPAVLAGPVKPLEGINMPGILVEPFGLSRIPAAPDKRNHFLKARARSIANAVLAFLADKGSGS